MSQGGPPFSSAAEAEAYVDQQVAEAKVQQERSQAMLAQMQALRVSGSSPGGEVEVTLGQSGGLLDVAIQGGAAGLEPAALRGAIMAANAQAQQALVRQVRDLVEENYGKDSATSAAFVSNYERSFPEPPQDVRPDPEIGGPR